MSHFLSGALAILNTYRESEEVMCKEFSRRKEEAREMYWDACKYPRKIKKKMRKEARADFELYSYLEKPMVFNF